MEPAQKSAEDKTDNPQQAPVLTHSKFGRSAQVVQPNTFEIEKHYYTKVLNAQIHPLVAHFMRMNNARISSRYCHLYPAVDIEALEELLSYRPHFFRWCGADLFNVTEATGGRKMVVIETNSCPSGQKSMPLLSEDNEANGYRSLMEHTFKPYVDAHKDELVEGRLAVIYDKNPMEASGYAAVMADVFGEEVLLAEYYEGDPNPGVRWNADRVMEVKKEASGEWLPVRAAFRYVTQKPWNRLPVTGSRTLIINPVLSCLAGGRNKLVADKAYELFNAHHESIGSNLKIRVPETIRDVSKAEVPLWVKSMGGRAVVKVPYSNAGQGVYTITNPMELKGFMDEVHDVTYDQYIVQSLIGNYKWSSKTHAGQYFHVGTIPDRNKDIYCADIRMMIHYDYLAGGFRPIAIYSRRAQKPLSSELHENEDSWAMLGTNLSEKIDSHTWTSDTSRLLLMDTRDFNKLGLGSDDLIDGYIQTVMAAVAIDKLASKLAKDGHFNLELFRSLDKDEVLLQELMISVEDGPKLTTTASLKPSGKNEAS